MPKILLSLLLLLPLGPVFAQTPADTSLVDQWYREGKELYYDGKYREAETRFRQLLELCVKAYGERHEQVYKVRERLGKTLYHLRRNEEALAMHRRNLPLAEALFGPRSEEVAACHLQIGNALSSMQEPGRAQAAYGACLDIYTKKYGAMSSEVGNMLMNLGIEYNQMGRYRDADRYFEQALSIFQQVSAPDSEDFNRIYSNMGVNYRKLGDLGKALDYAKKALEIKLKNYAPENASVAKYHRNIGRIYQEMGRFGEALPYLQRAHAIAGQALGEMHPSTAGALGELAGVYADLKEYRLALSSYREAVAVQEKLMPADHPYLLAGYSNIGLVYWELGRLDSALSYFQLALEGFENRSSSLVHRIAEVRRHIAGVYADQENFIGAVQQYQFALQRVVPGFSPAPGDLQANPKPDGIQLEVEFIQLLTGKAGALRSLQELEAAFQALELAIATIEKMRRGYHSELSRKYLLSETGPVFEQAVRLAFELYRKTNDRSYLWKAFQWSEKGKSSLLWQSLNEGYALEAAGLPPDALADLHDAESRIAALEEELAETDEDEQADDLRDELFELKLTYEQQIAALEHDFPRYYQLKYASPSLDSADLLRRLEGEGKHMALLEYFYDDRSLFLLLVRPEGIHGYEMPLTGDLSGQIRRVREQDVSALLDNSSKDAYLEALEGLYRLLLLPAEEELGGVDRLMIVPHGVLQYLPFEILVRPGGSAGDFRTANYLLRDFQIHYLWSAALWLEALHPAAESSDPYAGFAPAFTDGSGAAGPAGPFRGAPSPLPFALPEVERAHDLFAGRLFTGSTATESHFRQYAAHSRILHLATHAFADDRQPLYSGLLFSPEADTTFDGSLYAYEIYHLDLPAELAVMSACNTGYGELAEGEGVVSLGRAFSYAGCRSVVMSLWLANDAATATIVSDFYGYLAGGMPKDEALRQAKLNYLSTADGLTAHPYFWGALVAVGDMRPLPARGAPWGWMALSALGLGAFAFWRFVKKA